MLTAPWWARKQRSGWGERFGHIEPLPPRNGEDRATGRRNAERGADRAAGNGTSATAVRDASPPTCAEVPGQPKPRVLLHGVSWETYEGLLRVLGDEHPALRLTYREGTLEIMTTSRRHERIKKFIARLLEAWAEERNIRFDYRYADGFLDRLPALAEELVRLNPDVIGLDVGITLLSAENLRTGNVWRWFMRNSEITRAMRLIGLQRRG